jgi:transposase InsO family protein
VKYAFIHAHQLQFRVVRMCRVLAVSRSGFYAWCGRPDSARARANQQLVAHMVRLHQQTREAYGAVKLWRALQAGGVACGRHRVARLRQLHGLQTRRIRRFRITTHSRHAPPPAPNHLQQRFQADQPNQIWAGDITFIATRRGWVYLAVLLDLYSRRVVGWAMSTRLTEDLVAHALTMALHRRRPAPGLIHHSDQGCQYASGAYQQRLAQAGMTCSMSRKGNCYDNAVAESFFSTLKNELIHHRDYHTREEAHTEIFEFIEIFYNRQRHHQTLGYRSPVQYEEQVSTN